MIRSLTNLLDVGGDFLLDLLVARLVVGWLGGVHLVDPDDELLDAQREGEQRVLARLPVLADARLELARARRHDQHRAVRLRNTLHFFSNYRYRCTHSFLLLQGSHHHKTHGKLYSVNNSYLL